MLATSLASNSFMEKNLIFTTYIRKHEYVNLEKHIEKIIKRKLWKVNNKQQFKYKLLCITA